jgi:hypothetical protein
MAAGQGFKTFVTGEVLTAGDVNGYLMQGINVFTNATARDAAITAPAEGQFAFTKDNNSLWYYDGAAWVASGAAGDIEGVTAGIGISGGGTSGTVTVTNSMATAIDAKGDLVPGTGADTFSRLAVGANDTVLTADSSTATGLKWAAAAAPSYTYTTFTPTIKQGTTTFTVAANSGKWLKIGNLVHLIISSSISSGTGQSNQPIVFVSPVEGITPFTSGYPSGGTAAIYDASASINYPCLLNFNNPADWTFWGTTSNTNFLNMGQTGAPFQNQLTTSDNVSLNVVYPWA